MPYSLVRILNKWNNYLYIKSHVAMGWVEEEYISPINKNIAKELFFPEKFCIITQPSVTLCGEEYYMSCKIPILDGELKLPFNNGGNLAFKSCKLKEGCHIGYLPFSRNTVISQAIKFLDAPYDWGEKEGGLDCSSLIMHSFACCGITLPRNSADQSKITFPVSVFKKEDAHLAKPADIIYMPGHVMLALGDGYIIHASASAKKVCIGKL